MRGNFIGRLSTVSIAVLAMVALLFLLRAKASPPGDDAPTPLHGDSIPESLRAQWKERIAIEDAVRAEDRRKMVLPTPVDFVPAAKGKRIQLILRLRDKRIRPGDSMWYQLTLQNVGSEPIDVVDHESFLKRPSLTSSIDWRFYVTDPEGARREAIWGRPAGILTPDPDETRPVEIPGSERMTPEQVSAYIRRDQWRRKEERDLHIRLMPGEAIRSLPWHWRRIQPDPAYAQLYTRYDFKKPGAYMVQVVMTDPLPSPITEAEIKDYAAHGFAREYAIRDNAKLNGFHLGTSTSNSVMVSVDQP